MPRPAAAPESAEIARTKTARLWSAVAVTIADRIGRIIGEKRADRDQEEAGARPQGSLQRAGIVAVQEIGRGSSDLALGRADAVTVHNVLVHVRQAMERAGTPAAHAAGEELCQAVVALERREHECLDDLTGRVFPPAFAVATSALQRFKATLV